MLALLVGGCARGGFWGVVCPPVPPFPLPELILLSFDDLFSPGVKLPDLTSALAPPLGSMETFTALFARATIAAPGRRPERAG
jgi:hypothetical protein